MKSSLVTFKENTMSVETEKGIMEVTITDITPEQASILLSCNTENRNPRKQRIETYAEDMRNGKWKINGTPIVIGSDGILKDGQHRLMAIVKSGVTLKNQIIIFLPQEEASCYDIGSQRTTMDIMGYEGVTISDLKNQSVIGAITLCIKMKKGNVHYSPSKIDIIEKMKKYQDACSFFYTNLVTKAKKAVGIKRAGIGAAVINAYLSGYPLELLERFCKVLSSGIPCTKNDIGIIKLRDYVITSGRAGGGMEQVDLYYRTQNILHAFENGKLLTLCKKASTEYYSFPE